MTFLIRRTAVLPFRRRVKPLHPLVLLAGALAFLAAAYLLTGGKPDAASRAEQVKVDLQSARALYVNDSVNLAEGFPVCPGLSRVACDRRVLEHKAELLRAQRAFDREMARR